MDTVMKVRDYHLGASTGNVIVIGKPKGKGERVTFNMISIFNLKSLSW